MHKTSTLVSSFNSNLKANKQQSEMFVEEHVPSNQTILNILNYSKSLTIKDSKSIGFIEILVS
jgi:hypothetical protein